MTLSDRLWYGIIHALERFDRKFNLTDIDASEPAPRPTGRGPYGTGTRYHTGTLYRRVSTGPWIAHPKGDLDTPPACPGCRETEGLALLWIARAESVARFLCPTPECRTSWIDPAWATADVLVELIEPAPGIVEVPAWTTTQDQADDALADVAERMRYEAGSLTQKNS